MSLAAAQVLRERVHDLAAAGVGQLGVDDASPGGRLGHAPCREELTMHLRQLAEAVAVESPALFIDYATWVQIRHSQPDVSPLSEQLRALTEVARRDLPATVGNEVASMLEAASESLTAPAHSAGYLSGDDELSRIARRYFDDLLAFDHGAANQRLLAVVEHGTEIADLYLRVLQPVMCEVGRFWQLGKINVAQEHYCTAAVQGLMGQLNAHIFKPGVRRRVVLAFCVGDERHDVGMRMVADLATLRGFDARCLGGTVPVAELASIITRMKPEVVAISMTLVAHLGEVRDALRAVRAPGASKPRTIVGGYPFSLDPELWRRVGADGTAQDAVAAVDLIEEFTS